MTEKKLKIEFAPGCFDHFEGSQEELDDLITTFNNKNIKKNVNNLIQFYTNSHN